MNSTKPVARGNGIAGKLLLVFASLLFAFLLAEGVLHLVIKSEPQFLRWDGITGAWHREGVSGWYLQEGRGHHFKMSSAGLRDVEHSLEKPSGAFRIAILGDSYAEALQVDQSEAFSSVLEHLLNEKETGGRRIEVMNFGVSGFGTAQELITLRERVWRYSPDLVVLAFLSGNDVRNNSKTLEPEKDRPFFQLAGTNLVLDSSFRTPTGWSLKRSRLAPLASFVFDHSRIVFLIRKIQRARLAGGQGGLEAGLDQSIYGSPPNGAWNEAWEITERLLLQIADEVHHHRAGLLIVSLSNAFQVHPDKSIRERFFANRDPSDVFYPERRLEEFCRAHSLNLLVLAREMQRLAESAGTLWHGFDERGLGHWNEKGHRFAAEHIAGYLVTNRLTEATIPTAPAVRSSP